jgi:hypothetical protein
MIELKNIRDTGRGFEAAVILPTHNWPLKFKCRADGPASLDPSCVTRALLEHAVRKRGAKFPERLSLPLSELSLGQGLSS